MAKNRTKLTTKELVLFNSIANNGGSGWLHDVSSSEYAEVSHSEPGVLGSLIKKSYVTSEEQPEFGQDCYWVEITAKGYADFPKFEEVRD